jgi:acyl-CoA synthetase (NDP forming)
MTSSGAGASLMADKAAEYGIELADISNEAKARIPQRRSAILTNPFDTAGASRSPGFLSSVCEAFAADTANDCLLMYLGPLAVRHEYARNFAAAAEKFGKTAAAIVMLSEPDVREIFQAHHVPVFEAATDACFKTLRGYIDYGKVLASRSVTETGERGSRQTRPELMAILKAHRGVSMLPQAATAELLSFYGFKCAASRAASSAFDARIAAGKLGYPVILKALVPDVTHRSNAGLVSRKISSETEVGREYERLEANARRQSQDTVVVSVERFVAHDFEVIVGVKYDATFGPVLLCGLGGIFTEVLKDYALRVAPLKPLDAKAMLASLKVFPVLQQNAAWVKELTNALLRLSDLAVELDGKIKAVDINPLGLASGSSELTVLDAKIHL